MKIVIFSLITSTVMCLMACKHTPDSVTPTEPEDSDNTPAVVTPIGKPLGVPVTQTIGPAGGTLLSADGQVSIELPAGALSQPTPLSLQPIEQTMTSGAGTAFIISPKNTKLNKPVTIAWHYTPTTMSGSAPELVGLAYQDDKGVWRGKPSTEVDKSKQTIKARMSTFAHAMSWYEQYFIFPRQKNILPNERVQFSVYFQPGRTEASSEKDDIHTVLTNLLNGDEALHQLTETELRKWMLNGTVATASSAEQQAVWGTLNYLSRGGSAQYIAPRAMLPRDDKNPNNPTVTESISVELNLKQKGKLMLVSTISMTDPGNTFSVGSKSFPNPYVSFVAQDNESGCSLNLKENVPLNASRAGTLMFSIPASLFTGTGTYVVNANDKAPALTISAGDGMNTYGISWSPEPNVINYGPISITITEFGGPGKPVTGKVTGTLHRYISSEKRYEHVGINARFRVINDYFTGG